MASKKRERVGLNDGKIPKPVRDDILLLRHAELGSASSHSEAEERIHHCVPSNNAKYQFPKTLKDLTSYRPIVLSSSQKQEMVGLNDGKIPKPVRDDVYTNDAKHQNPKTVKNLFTYLLSGLFTSRKAAFTLAEMLIVIAIVGVVAALTIPALMQNIQSRIKATRIQNIKQKISKATDSMQAISSVTGYRDTLSFVNELSKHLRIAKICDNHHLSECWPYESIMTKKDINYTVSVNYLSNKKI